MTEIVNDPAKLRSFRSDLAANAIFWEAMLKKLEVAMNRLGDSWKDDQYKVFQNEIFMVKRSLEKLSEDTRKTMDELERDALKLEKYRNIG